MKKLQSFTIAVALSIGSQAQTVTNGLVAHYPLDGDAQDISPNQIHGTVYGAVAANDRNGNPNSCMYFNGLGDFIEILSNNANTPELVSVSLWVKPENRTNRHTPISKRLIHNAHPHNSYAITTTEIGPNGKWQFAVSDTISISQTTINDTNLYSLDWTHLVGTYDGNEMHLYVDGQLVSSVPKSGNVLYTNMTLRIGHAIPGTSQTDTKDGLMMFVYTTGG